MCKKRERETCTRHECLLSCSHRSWCTQITKALAPFRRLPSKMKISKQNDLKMAIFPINYLNSFSSTSQATFHFTHPGHQECTPRTGRVESGKNTASQTSAKLDWRLAEPAPGEHQTRLSKGTNVCIFTPNTKNLAGILSLIPFMQTRQRHKLTVTGQAVLNEIVSLALNQYISALVAWRASPGEQSASTSLPILLGPNE